MTKKDLFAEIPKGLDAPIEIDATTQQIEFWSGKAKFLQGDNETIGHGRVFLDTLPIPRFRFEFEPDEEPSLKDILFKSSLGDTILECESPIGPINCNVTQAGKTYSGYIEDQVDDGDALPPVATAVYIAINGPNVLGSPIKRANTSFTGRMNAAIEGTKITIDRLSPEKQERRDIYKSTHVVRCVFSPGRMVREVATISKILFRSLSLMKCRWVGLLGPWLYDSGGNEIGFRLSITKTTRHGGAISWCYESIKDCFAELFPAMYASFTNDKRASALQTAFHWLIEAEQCAGGVEGTIILQQAALECLAWLEVVQERRLCSESGFKSLPATDKIRWLLSLYKIEARIPDKSDAINSYAKAFNLVDLIDVLVDVRNVLVHAEPKKADRLFSRKKGDEERINLRYQIGGILQQAFLASIGYKGKMFRRDVDSEYACNAVRPVPWASTCE